MKNLHRIRRDVEHAEYDAQNVPVLGVPRNIVDPLAVLEALMRGGSKEQILIYLARHVAKKNDLLTWRDWKYDREQGPYLCCRICRSIITVPDDLGNDASIHSALAAHADHHINELTAGKFRTEMK